MALETSGNAQSKLNEPAQLADRIILKSSDDTVELKQLILNDAENYFLLVDFDRAHLSQHGNVTAQKYPTVEAVRTSIEKPNIKKYRFGIWDQGTMVGSVNLTLLDDNRAESGSWVGKAHTGHNYAARARKLLIDFGFNQLHVSEIISKIVVGNLPSRRSVEKSGFEYSGDIEEDGKKHWLFALKNPKAGGK